MNCAEQSARQARGSRPPPRLLPTSDSWFCSDHRRAAPPATVLGRLEPRCVGRWTRWSIYVGSADERWRLANHELSHLQGHHAAERKQRRHDPDVLTTYNDHTASNGTIYYYRVAAINSVGEGQTSGEVSARPTAGATVPGAP